VFGKSKRRVSVNKMNPVLHAYTKSGEIASVEPSQDRSATEGISKLLRQRVEQIQVGLLMQVRDIDFNPCLLGQRQ